ncbi:MAG TPA: HisA/HisF-related TIM barrel protein [Stellaceae bacterium]|nr:HisA/HisF-related TIM barrel protein [Stellaceae bacterium]
MDFIFMLTRADRTVDDCLEVLEEVAGLGLRHIGFKDVGVAPEMLATLHRRIKAAGATSYLEVVSLTPETALISAAVARQLGVDRLLGGADAPAILAAIEGSGIEYHPFVGTPHGHPTLLAGSPEEIAHHCRRADEMGCAGVDLLAFRAEQESPTELIRAARAALRGRLVVAGSISSPDQVAELASLGVDAFTVGTALFEKRFGSAQPSLRAQLAEVLSAAA